MKKIAALELKNKVTFNADLKKDIIDIREKSELKGNKIIGSQHVPMNTLRANPAKYLSKQKGEEKYIICASGGRSGITCTILRFKGYKVINVSGGMAAYNGK